MPTILLCITEKVRLQQMKPYLEKAGYTVSNAEWVEDAFDRLSQSPEAYDLVFSDMMLLGGTNFDLMKRCADHPPTASIPILTLVFPPNESPAYDEWQAKPIKYEFMKNGRDAFVVAFWWQKEFILPAIRAVLERQAAQAKSKTGE